MFDLVPSLLPFDLANNDDFGRLTETLHEAYRSKLIEYRGKATLAYIVFHRSPLPEYNLYVTAETLRRYCTLPNGLFAKVLCGVLREQGGNEAISQTEAVLLYGVRVVQVCTLSRSRTPASAC